MRNYRFTRSPAHRWRVEIFVFTYRLAEHVKPDNLARVTTNWKDLIFLLLLLAAVTILVVKFVISWRKDAALEAVQRRESNAEYEKKRLKKLEEDARKRRLRELDTKVDPIIAKCISGRRELVALLKRIKEPILSSSECLALRQWTEDHPLVAGFPMFEEIWTDIANGFNSGSAISKSDVIFLLDDEMDFEESCIRCADKILGITRLECFVDEAERGWTEIETASGGFEPVDTRYQRVYQRIPGADRGYVYVLTNETMPGLIKIGSTKKDPLKRASSLSSHTGVPGSFKVAYSLIVGNYRLIEKLAHERLNIHRIQQNREFFRLSVNDAAKTIQLIEAEIT